MTEKYENVKIIRFFISFNYHSSRSQFSAILLAHSVFNKCCLLKIIWFYNFKFHEPFEEIICKCL